jgi:hypothetical protein
MKQFKFKHCNDDGVIYTATQDGSGYAITWVYNDGRLGEEFYGEESVERILNKGIWTVVEDITCSAEEPKQEVPTLLEKVKQFAKDTGNEVYINKNGYLIGTDNRTYAAKDDEELERKMEAIRTLYGEE